VLEHEGTEDFSRVAGASEPFGAVALVDAYLERATTARRIAQLDQ
jgi:hypothetical protein